MVTPSIIASSCRAPRSRVKSFPSGTFFWNGSERSVSHVPGCRQMHATFVRRRENSRDMVLVS